MKRYALAAVVLMGIAVPAQAAGISGLYVEARTCDIWTGPCFANAEYNLSGRNAIMAWAIDKGTACDVRLDGLGVVAVICASDTLGVEQTGPARAILIVDKNASPAQRDALVKLAQRQGGELLKNIVSVHSADVSLRLCDCKEGGCAELRAGPSRCWPAADNRRSRCRKSCRACR
jgi:hypothetical protein